MRTYSATDGWGTVLTLLDDARTDVDLYKTLSQLGFTQHQELLYRAGTMRLYTRQSISAKRSLPFAFDFCCTLSMNSFVYPVGLKSFGDVLTFLKEVDASPAPPKATQSVKLTNIDALTDSLSDVTSYLEELVIILKGVKVSQKALVVDV